MIHISLQELYNILGPLFGGAITAFVQYLIKKREKAIRLKRSDPVVDSVKNNVLVETKLDEIIKEYEADRVWITQFHNGGNFYPSGRSITKFSVFYENSRPGINPIRDKYQNIPVSIFSRSINYLCDNDVISIEDTKKAAVSGEYDTLSISKDTDAKSTYMVAIKTIDNKFIGLLGVSYIKKKKPLSDNKIKDLQIYATSIGSVLVKH